MSVEKSSLNIRYLILGLLLLFIISVIHLSQGTANFTWVDRQMQTVLLGVRLPRLVIGILSGGVLAIAGLLLQTLTKNPLASAGTLGINAGAYFFVTIGSIFLPEVSKDYPFLLAFLGSIMAAGIVFILVGRIMDPVRVALTGMIISLLFSALTSGLQFIYEQETNGLFLWGAGSLVQNNWSGVTFALPSILITVSLVSLIAKWLDLLLLGDETATNLGVPVQKAKVIGWILAIILASITVSVVGPIGFIGLMAPHIVRLFGINGHRWQILHSFIWGAFLLITADVFARVIYPTGEIPVGSITAIIGGPWLMYLAYRMGKRYVGQKQNLKGSISKLPYPFLLTLILILTVIIGIISLMYGGGDFYSIKEVMDGALWQWASIQFRWPRVLVSFIIGSILALCGVVLQSILRNPLGDPSILGITSGGGAGALIIIVLFPTLPFAFVPVGAVIGSSISILAILITSRRSEWEPISLSLMGVAVSAVGSGIIQILTVKATVGVAPALVWLAGSTYGMNWRDVMFITIISIIIVPVCYWFTKELDILALNKEISIGLGLNVNFMRISGLVLAVLIGSASVAIAGAIGFLGLLAPQAARSLVGTKHYRVIPLSMSIGGMLLVAADFLSRFLIYPNEIPSGLLVALIGSPYILYIIRKL